MTYTVIMCGDRHWKHKEIIEHFFEDVLPKHTVVIQGGCRGADTIVKEEGEKYGYKVIKVDAKWEKYGLSDGPIRNEEMMKKNPNWIIEFHEHIEYSKGTKHMISLAKKYKCSWVLVGNNGVIDSEDFPLDQPKLFEFFSKVY